MLKDRNYRAEDYLVDTDLVYGHNERRSCTDLGFLFVFALLVGAYAWTANYAFTNGQIE